MSEQRKSSKGGKYNPKISWHLPRIKNIKGLYRWPVIFWATKISRCGVSIVRKALLIVIIVTLLGGMLAWQMTQNRGYILIAYGNYSIDMTLWAFFLIIGILSVFFVVLKKDIIRCLREIKKNTSALLIILVFSH